MKRCQLLLLYNPVSQHITACSGQKRLELHENEVILQQFVFTKPVYAI